RQPAFDPFSPLGLHEGDHKGDHSARIALATANPERGWTQSRAEELAGGLPLRCDNHDAKIASFAFHAAMAGPERAAAWVMEAPLGDGLSLKKPGWARGLGAAGR